MAEKYVAYPEYKESGGEGLGEIPEDWKIVPIKHLATLNPKKSNLPQDMMSVKCSFVPMEKLKFNSLVLDEEKVIKDVYDGYTYFKNEDILIAKVTPCFENKNTAIAQNLINGIGFGSSEIYVLRVNDSANNRYLFYRLQEAVFISVATAAMTGAGGLRRVPAETINTYSVAAPSISEQNQIANFLDYETAQIDTLIEKQQTLIQLLKEKRQAVISHAVTKGLNPDAPMKDSGIEWLGEVPEHWVVTRIKYITSMFEQGWSPQCDSRPAEINEYGVLKVGCVNYGSFHSIENKALPPELEPRLQYLIKKHDLLISRANTRELVGSATVVDQDYNNLLLCDKLYRLRFDSDIQPELIALYLSIEPVREQIELQASGASSSMQNISQDVIKELPCFLLPNEEAYELLDSINEKMKIFDDLIKKAEQAIQLMQERRTALISAAVTGKIDVRSWQVPNVGVL